jgi:hypothetical protein
MKTTMNEKITQEFSTQFEAGYDEIMKRFPTSRVSLDYSEFTGAFTQLQDKIVESLMVKYKMNREEHYPVGGLGLKMETILKAATSPVLTEYMAKFNQKCDELKE